jgi:hypothetical protein
MALEPFSRRKFALTGILGSLTAMVGGAAAAPAPAPPPPPRKNTHEREDGAPPDE